MKAVPVRVIVSSSSEEEDADVDDEEEESEDDEIIDDDDDFIMLATPGARVTPEASSDDDDYGDGAGDDEDDPIEVLDDDEDLPVWRATGGGARGPGAPPLPAWRARLPHFVSIGDIEARGFVLDGQPVHIDYRRQFTGTSAARTSGGAARGGAAGGSTVKRRAKRAPGEARWLVEGGVRTFITPKGDRLTGKAAYRAYQKHKAAEGT
jgi:hypothetical protein